MGVKLTSRNPLKDKMSSITVKDEADPDTNADNTLRQANGGPFENDKALSAVEGDDKASSEPASDSESADPEVSTVDGESVRADNTGTLGQNDEEDEDGLTKAERIELALVNKEIAAYPGQRHLAKALRQRQDTEASRQRPA